MSKVFFKNCHFLVMGPEDHLVLEDGGVLVNGSTISGVGKIMCTLKSD